MSVGLRRGTVQIEDYDPQWPVAFEIEKGNLLDMLGDKLLAIEHIGSTSVPGLPAKPIIDMLGAVQTFNELGYFITKLQEAGYEYMPERMFADRKFFPKGPHEQRTHHLSLVLISNAEQWNEKLLFRDYLRIHPEVGKEYAELKLRLATQYTDNREAYTAAKNDFITEIMRKALEHSSS